MNPLWFLVVGGLLMMMGFAGSSLNRLPCSSAMFYLAIGYGIGPAGLGLIRVSFTSHAALLLPLTEIAVLVSLFAVGLRLRVPPIDKIWSLPLRLGIVGMVVTVCLMTLVGVYLLKLPVGLSMLLGAILAPTDPVLAHEVQIDNPGNNDTVRFALSGEGGLNDGTAFPFVLLALALLAPGTAVLPALSKWIALNLVWGVAAGLGCGWLLGTVVGRLIVFLRKRYNQALGLEGFFALGLIGLAYGIALVIEGYGFLAVFAAGLALRRVEHKASGDRDPAEVIGAVELTGTDAVATDPVRAQAFMTEMVLDFTVELERIAEVSIMLVIGSMLSSAVFSWQSVVLIVALFLVVRPVAVWLSLIGTDASASQFRLIAWFGIRGVGSFYYLLYALVHGSPFGIVRLAPWIMAAIAASVVVHGISATPLMRRYHARRARYGGP